MSSTRIILRNPSGYRGPKGDKGDPGAPGGGGTGPGVATGGTAGQVLAKIDSTNFNTHWVDQSAGGGTGIPDGGSTAQVLTKVSGTDGDADWETPIALATTTPQALGTAAVGTGTSSARSNHVHAMPTLSQVLAPTGDVAWGSHKITSVANPTSDQDAATKNYTDAADDLLQQTATLQDDILDLFPGMTLTVTYDEVAAAWPTIDVSLTGDARVAFLFRGSDESTPPPTVTGNATWVRPVS